MGQPETARAGGGDSGARRVDRPRAPGGGGARGVARARERGWPRRSQPEALECSTTTSRWKGCGLDNLAIARILREIADLLEIKSENPFKIRAYRNGGDIVATHPHALSQLDDAGLREIPGIGKDLAARIREIAQTGDAEFHRELVGEFPP